MNDLLWIVLLSPLMGMAYLIIKDRNSFHLQRCKICSASPGETPFLPPAEETSRSIRRFKEVAERYALVDFAWNWIYQGVPMSRNAPKMRRLQVSRSKKKIGTKINPRLV